MKLPEPHQEGETIHPTLDLNHRNLFVPQGKIETIRGESLSNYPQDQVPKGARMPSKMNLSLSSPQDELEILLRVIPTVKSHRKQTKLLQNFTLTFEEIN